MYINYFNSKVIFTKNIQYELSEILKKKKKKIFIIIDKNTKKYCLPILDLKIDFQIIEIPEGEKNKNLKTCLQIWDFLFENNAERNSLLINLGGGLICDIGGFAASTFKRGIEFINIPTSLLSQVDASVGGKVGINYRNAKNEIGLFMSATYILIDTKFLLTLDKRNIFSGFAEMIKHSLISDIEDFNNLIEENILKLIYKKNKNFLDFVYKSVKIKNFFVSKDPFEKKGFRKVLNFGHTIGHSIESFSLKKSKNLLHGEALMIGMICELYISHIELNFPKKILDKLISFYLKNYEKYIIEESDIKNILYLMQKDKKKINNKIYFPLLNYIGKIKIENILEKEKIIKSLQFYKNI